MEEEIIKFNEIEYHIPKIKENYEQLQSYFDMFFDQVFNRNTDDPFKISAQIAEALYTAILVSYNRKFQNIHDAELLAKELSNLVSGELQKRCNPKSSPTPSKTITEIPNGITAIVG